MCGVWSDNYYSFGAYTYAVDYYITCEYDGMDWMMYDPGQIAWVLNGNDPEKYYFNQVANAETIADWIQYDLEKLGYSISSISMNMPDTDVDDHTKLICVRKDDDGIPTGGMIYGEMEYWYDYHVMKKGPDGRWYHKPHTTNPLRYKYTPTYDREWVYEVANFDPPEYFRRDDWTYESEIWFIEYTTPHIWEYAFWGNGKHVMCCTICGEEKLENCQWESPSYLAMNTHQFMCKLCEGVGNNTPCTMDYIQYFDTEEGLVHQRICTVCKHNHSEPELCDIESVYNGDGTHTATCAICGNSCVENCAYHYTYNDGGIAHIHIVECLNCNYSHEVSHAYIYKSNGNNTHSQVCGDCGHLKQGPSSCMFKSDYTCRICGAVRDSAVINSLEAEFGEE